MSAEYRPVSAIPFRDIDKRLEKYGIKVDRSGHRTTLTGPNGILVANLKAIALISSVSGCRYGGRAECDSNGVWG